MNISNNISSIQSHQIMMNTNANNIANVNTDGFKPTDTKMSANGNSITANNHVSDDNGIIKSQTDLSKEIPNQMIVQGSVSSNVMAIKAQDEILGTLLDLKI